VNVHQSLTINDNFVMREERQHVGEGHTPPRLVCDNRFVIETAVRQSAFPDSGVIEAANDRSKLAQVDAVNDAGWPNGVHTASGLHSW
jgi:S-formylglutathione hydrolase FrmB